nr:MAG TPA: hypothetical protein [Caudoviricetes sp.]
MRVFANEDEEVAMVGEQLRTLRWGKWLVWLKKAFRKEK